MRIANHGTKNVGHSSKNIGHSSKLTGHGSKTTAPLKSLADIHAMQHYFLSIAKSAPTPSKRMIGYRNWLFFVLGINLGYRGGDITELTWDKLVTYNPSSNTYVVRKDEYNRINAEKTGKSTILYFNAEAERCINFYLKATGIKPIPNTPVFFSRKSAGTKECTIHGHIDCDNMGRILKQAAKACGISGNICTHSLRKTFGYQYYRETGDIITLQKILGHENPGITLTYIGITAEDIMHAYDAKPNTCIDNLDAWLPDGNVADVPAPVDMPVATSQVVTIQATTVQVATVAKSARKPSSFYSEYKYPIKPQGGVLNAKDSIKHYPSQAGCKPAKARRKTSQPNIRYLPHTRWQGVGIAN